VTGRRRPFSAVSPNPLPPHGTGEPEALPHRHNAGAERRSSRGRSVENLPLRLWKNSASECAASVSAWIAVRPFGPERRDVRHEGVRFLVRRPDVSALATTIVVDGLAGRIQLARRQRAAVGTGKDRHSAVTLRRRRDVFNYRFCRSGCLPHGRLAHAETVRTNREWHFNRPRMSGAKFPVRGVTAQATTALHR